MTKVVILPLSLYVNNVQQRTQAAFRALGIGKWEMIWHFLPLPSFLEKFRGPSLSTLFDQYRRGDLSTSAFRQKIRDRFPHAKLDIKNFNAAWNAMQEVNDITKQALNEAQTLVKKGIEVYLISGTNFLHIQDIKKKLQQTQLPGIPYFSFQQKKLGSSLFTALLKDIRAKHENITCNDIAYFYTPPQDPYPRLGKLAWLNPFAIIKNIEYFKAKQYVASLQREASSKNGFSLISYQPKIEKNANIISKIEQLGWIKTARQTKVRHQSPAIIFNQKVQKVALREPATHSYNLRARKPGLPR